MSLKRPCDGDETRFVFVDAALCPVWGRWGLAAVVRDGHRAVMGWMGEITGPLTNNEAEYAAAIMALNYLQRDTKRPIVILSDSQTLVHQMQGRAATRSRRLQVKQAELRQLTAKFASVQFEHISRGQNKLADALANEVVDGESPVGEFRYEH